MRVLVTGSRHFGFKLEERDKVFGNIEDLVESCKNLYTSEYEDLTIIHGAAKGVDTAAEHWATLCNVPQEKYPADWEAYGKAAGPIRNKQMLDEGKPDMVIAFLTKVADQEIFYGLSDSQHSRGTKDMIKQALKANIPVKVINI